MPRGILPWLWSEPVAATGRLPSSRNSAGLVVRAGNRRARLWALCLCRGSAGEQRVARSLLLGSLPLFLLIVVGATPPPPQSISPPATTCSDSTPLDDLLTEGKRLAQIDQNATARLCFEKAISLAVSAGN